MQELIMGDPEVLKSVLNAIPHGVAVAGLDGKMIYFNSSAQRILGMELMAANPQEWAKIYGVFLTDQKTPFPTEEYPLVKALQGENVKKVEQFIKNAHSKEGVYISADASPILDNTKRVVGAVVIFTDITNAKKNEQERARYENEQQRLNDLLLQREGRMEQLKSENANLKSMLKN